MEKKNQRLSCEEVKQWDMVDYLSGLGYEPAKIRNNDYWYLSPLRDEKTPSFKVNRKLNKWYDHGLGKGGSLVDFGIAYHKCTVSELLEKLSGGFSFQPHQPMPSNRQEKESKINILSKAPITSPSLIKYLEDRKISTYIATQYCSEVRYEINEKTFFGIGFNNDLGGVEIRNPFFKSSSSPKGVTTISDGTYRDQVAVFEGFFDFLSYKTLYPGSTRADEDFLILNSVSFFEKARPFMEGHDHIKLYLDQDKTGQNFSALGQSINDKYEDCSSLYKGYDDLNDWLVKSADKSQAIKIRQIPEKRKRGKRL